MELKCKLSREIRFEHTKKWKRQRPIVMNTTNY